MPALQDKVQNVLDEARMLVLGAQVLLGFQYRCAFEPGFRGLRIMSQRLIAAVLLALVVVLALLMSPGAYHQVVEGGEDTRQVHGFATTALDLALFPFAAALGANVFIVTEKAAGEPAGVLA